MTGALLFVAAWLAVSFPLAIVVGRLIRAGDEALS